MGGKIFIFLLTVTFIPNHAQRSELLPQAPRSDLSDNTKTTKPKANQDSVVDVLSNTFNLFTNVPIELARTVGGGGGINGVRVPFNNYNFASISENFISDYNFGLRNEDCKLSCDQLLTKYGHPVEMHEVITEDGYVLKMFRIPGNGSVVLLQHGLTGSADDFVLAGPDSGLAYLLANNGYDVWLANSRGCKHSRRHIKLKPSQGTYWDFSWHEVGYYDLPAMIDYALNVTGQDKLKFIGHSQGTTAFFVMGSDRPEYMGKIALMIALSPSAFNSHMRSPFIRLVAPSSGLLFALSKTFGVHELANDNSLMRLIRWITCGTGPIAELVCSNLMFLIAGFNVEQLNVTNLPVIFNHIPAGASAKQFIHYAQEIISKKFRQFDYGAAENKERYGSSEPPDYEIKNITAPIALVYSEADWLTDYRDVAKLRKLLPNVVESYKVPHKNFNHMDFIIAKDVKYLVYKKLLKVLSRN